LLPGYDRDYACTAPLAPLVHGMALANVTAGATRASQSRRPVKIALISALASPLGPLGEPASGAHAVYVRQLARALACAGHQVDVFTRRDDLWSAPEAELAPNATVVYVPAGPPRALGANVLLPYLDEFAARVAEHCAPAQGRYDVVHASFFASGPAALRLKARFGIPFVATYHSLARVLRRHPECTDAYPSERARIEDALAAQAGGLVAGSRQELQELAGLCGADSRRIAIVPCGFDPAQFAPGPRSARARLGLGADDFVLLHAGRLGRGDGVDNAIRALARLRSDHAIDARLLVVGGEHEEPDPRLSPGVGRLLAVAAAQGVADRVVVAGARPRAALGDYYRAADVFVTTPVYEPFSLAATEALACGIPVVGSAVGGIAHVVQDEVTGFLVPADDPGALAERLARLRRNPELARAYGRAGIRRVRAGFTWHHVAAQMAGVYASVLLPLRARLASAVM
jgi:glycosyltransferase involved in cell wall biosynthesis